MAEANWWDDDPAEVEKKRKQTEAINAANPGGEDPGKSYVQSGQTGGYLAGVGETLEAGRSTTTGDRDRYIADARAAGASDEYMQDFLARNPGDYSRLKRVWMDETVDQPDSNNPNVDPNQNYNYGNGNDDDDRDATDQWTQPTEPTKPVEPAKPTEPYIPTEPTKPVEPVVDPNIERIRTMLTEAQTRDKERADQLWKQLSGQAQQGLDVDRNDPTIRAQADAYNANEQRSASDYMADLAEGSSPYTNMLGEQRLSAERIGQRTGGFEAELMGRELSARRDEIAQALAGQGAMLTADQQRSLTQELALMDNAIKEKQLTADQGLGYARLGLDTELGRAGVTLGQNRLGLDTELGRGGLQLSQQELKQRWDEAMLRNEQFRQQLGFDTSRFASDDDYRRSYY